MTTTINTLSPRDQLDIALHGSQQFHQKTASIAAGQFPEPDTRLPGHEEMAGQLQGLSEVFAKIAEAVNQGYPAKLALTLLARQQDIPQAYQAKLASFIDDTALQTLESIQQLQQDRLQPAAAAKTATGNTEAGPRVTQAFAKGQQLAAMAGWN